MRLRALTLTILSFALATTLLVPAAPAAAHDALASAAPAVDSTVSGDLDRVTLSFSEAPLAGLESGLVISVTGPDGTEASTGTVRVDGSTLTKRVDLAKPGRYNLGWRSVSVDGHPISGTYQFTSTGAPVAPSSTPTSTPTVPVTPEPAATTELSATPAAAADTARDTGPAVWVLAALTAVLIMAIIAVLLITRRRPKSTE
ncbi:copper resistance protein CopC [Curtobacterium flaccumfaciens pv. oortii]|uniref:copper resistance CopC family protein n=1 Tax=Curtobacterium flaccumfaciens TaxID=2035 RepID=UPI001BDF55E0|nr:copper resistance CopC family protein [Curtobacterium flaccumfaciens]MBT1621202.1 copper resistance protein CopC [Curtobacterium flaccumfaciens pv. oortii]